MRNLTILVVEDEALLRKVMAANLKKFGQVFTAENAANAQNIIDSYKLDLAFVDLDLDRRFEGLEVLKMLKEKQVYSIILSGNDGEECIQRAYEVGCNDYYVKGRDLGPIDEVINKFLSYREDDSLDKFLKEEFITQDPPTIEQLSLLKEVRNNADPVLILGPTGTGKTLIARKIHKLARCEGDFIEINCSAIPENLLESELFGHVKGSFTGAVSNKDGLLLKAHRGIIFLDEVGALPVPLQAKLLKALEEKSFTPVGGLKPVQSDFRIVSATCEDLDEYRKVGQFRNDLFFRLSGINIHLRPLSERKGDIAQLITYFLASSARKIALTKEARERLLDYSWPGNCRELKKVINMLLTKQKGLIALEDLPQFIREEGPSLKSEGTLMTPEIKAMAREIGLYETVELLKNEIMRSVLTDNSGKVNKTIGDLKISTNTYYKLMKNEKPELFS